MIRATSTTTTTISTITPSAVPESACGAAVATGRTLVVGTTLVAGATVVVDRVTGGPAGTVIIALTLVVVLVVELVAFAACDGGRNSGSSNSGHRPTR